MCGFKQNKKPLDRKSNDLSIDQNAYTSLYTSIDF